jgi:FixJ family two-component response regulator
MKDLGELPSRRAVVVVVDDDPAVRGSLKFSLEIEGFAVHLYDSGTALLAVSDLPTCCCLVIDQKMPGISGLELISKLRARNIATPAILITSHPSVALRTLAATANISIIEKPLLNNTLLECIHLACSQD